MLEAVTNVFDIRQNMEYKQGNYWKIITCICRQILQKIKKVGENVLTESGRWKTAGTLLYLAAQQMKEAARDRGKKNM